MPLNVNLTNLLDPIGAVVPRGVFECRVTDEHGHAILVAIGSPPSPGAPSRLLDFRFVLDPRQRRRVELELWATLDARDPQPATPVSPALLPPARGRHLTLT